MVLSWLRSIASKVFVEDAVGAKDSSKAGAEGADNLSFLTCILLQISLNWANGTHKL